MENRVELLRKFIDGMVQSNPQREWWFVERHMFSVSNFAAMLAMKRSQNAEIAVMIGLLHDIHTLLTDSPKNHAELGSMKAREILLNLKIVSNDELEIICNAIKNHCSKNVIQDAYSELAKDADVLSHYFTNPSLPVIDNEKVRLRKLLDEFAVNPVISEKT